VREREPRVEQLSCSTVGQNAWNVLIVRSLVLICFSSLSNISWAALSEKVRAKICSGFKPLLYKVEDFFRDYPGFTGTGTGEDELYAGTDDGVELGGGEGHY